MSSLSRAMSVLTKTVGALIALVLVAYLATNLFSLARGWHLRGQLADEFTAAAQPLLPELRAGQAALVEEVGREPDRAWIEQVCSFNHDDSGWMINNYREQCSVRSVRAWQVESVDAGRNLLSVTPPEYPLSDPTCDDLGTRESGTIDVTLALAGRDMDRECGHETAWGGQTRQIDGDAAPLPVDSTWVVVAEDTGNLVDAAIGCAHWSVLFCDNPFTDHAWADLD